MKNEPVAAGTAPSPDRAQASPPDNSRRILFHSILLATDFSAVSDAALEHALSIARHYDARLSVAHVVPPDVYLSLPLEITPVALGQAREHAEHQMTQLLVSGRLRGVSHQVLLEHGQLWTAIARMVEQHDVDLVVVGTHGRTGARKLLLGSAAEEVFRLCLRPVLTVGPCVTAEVPKEMTLRRILYATDFTPNSERAAAYALSLAREYQAHLTLLHVVKESEGLSPAGRSKLEEMFQRRLRRMLPEDGEPWCDPELLVSFGTPADQILHAAAEQQADLIVLGVRRSATFAGHLPPATAYKVVCQAVCPVLTVRGSSA